MPKTAATSNETLWIPRFMSGLVSQRNVLNTPFTFVGLNVIQHNDALCDGSNIELTNLFTLKRRGGFPRFCSAQLGASEIPLNFGTYRSLTGSVTPFVDTNTRVASFTTSAYTTIFTKSTTNQTYDLTVGLFQFFMNGSDFFKWNGTNLWKIGIAAPAVTPTIGFSAGSLSPASGYSWVYVYKNANTGYYHISTASPFSANTGAQTSKQFTISGQYSNDAQVTNVDIYRTLDGGGLYYFVASISNTVGSGTWTYTDNNADSTLNILLLAPLAHINDPPPGQTGSLVTTGGTLMEWHMGRVWVASGNNLYFSAGPDCTNGDGNASFPPANVFPYRGNITGLWSTSQGLVVFTNDAMYAVLGSNTASFYSITVMKNFGILSRNCLDGDGDAMVIYSSKSQLFEIQPGTSQTEVGFNIGDLLKLDFSPTSTYLTVHRSGTDSGIFISDGATNVGHYNVNTQGWSTLWQLGGSGGIKAVKSIETSSGNYTLMAGRASANAYVLGRSLSTYIDDASSTYSAFATIGNITLSNAGEPLFPLTYVLGYFAAVGTVPTLSFLPNEITGATGIGFVPLPKYVNEPPVGAAPSTTISALRYFVNMNQRQVSQLVHHVQVKVSFVAENQPSEIFAIGLSDRTD